MIVTMLQCRVLYSQVVFADCLQVIDKLSGQVLALEESNVKFTEEVRILQPGREYHAEVPAAFSRRG